MSINSNPESNSPYVVSADVGNLVSGWGLRNGLVVPTESYFDDMTEDLRSALLLTTGLPVEVVSHRELGEGIDAEIARSEHPVYSLDRAYVDDDHPGVAGFIDMTRAVDHRDLSLIPGTPPRPGKPSIEEQLEALRTSSESPVTLVDDVIFTGEGAVELAKKMRAVGRPVARLITGIGISEGVQKLEEAGIEVVCVRSYDDVADEVCERDFVAGVPMSGRTVLNQQTGEHWSAPYFAPFGNAAEWASIPKNRMALFSRLCLAQSVALWNEIGDLNGRSILANEVPRRLGVVAGNHSSFADILNQGFDSIK